MSDLYQCAYEALSTVKAHVFIVEHCLYMDEYDEIGDDLFNLESAVKDLMGKMRQLANDDIVERINDTLLGGLDADVHTTKRAVTVTG